MRRNISHNTLLPNPSNESTAVVSPISFASAINSQCPTNNNLPFGNISNKSLPVKEVPTNLLPDEHYYDGTLAQESLPNEHCHRGNQVSVSGIANSAATNGIRRYETTSAYIRRKNRERRLRNATIAVSAIDDSYYAPIQKYTELSANSSLSNSPPSTMYF